LLQQADRLSKSIYVLASGLYFGAVILRSLLIYRGDPILPRLLGLQALVMALYILASLANGRLKRIFPLYLVVQTALVFVLLGSPGYPDFFAVFLNLLSMQVMLGLRPRFAALWIILCALGLVFVFYKTYGLAPAIALALIYTAGNVFLGMYTLATRRAFVARRENQELAQELQSTNRRLADYSAQLERLAVARERNHLARELHDSVTQTVFSMTLVTQAAITQLGIQPGTQSGSQPDKVAAHLERLNQLSRSALGEIQVLISELGMESVPGEGLAGMLRRHLAGSRLPPELVVTLDVSGGGQPLTPAEEQGLFRIAEEALNNIAKHAQAAQASLRLHLEEPFWMEIEDHGQGFDPGRAPSGEHMGLRNMHGRAAEIGWQLQVTSAPGAGTLIRVEKAPVKEGVS
jgi:signal transduction histidine kinase